VRDFDQIPVRITEVHGSHRSGCADFWHRSHLNHYSTFPEMFDYPLDRLLSNETKVAGARCGMKTPGFELFAALVKIDLLPPQAESLATFAKSDDLHAENCVVETARFLNVSHGENKVIDVKDIH